MSDKPKTLLIPECGSHCGVKETAHLVVYVGHCNCKECHNGTAPESHFIDRRKEAEKSGKKTI